jgi:hypothetical protein
MSLERSYKCDGCGRIMAPGAPCLSLYVEETDVENEIRSVRRGKRRRVSPRLVGHRDVQIDMCGDCRARDVNIMMILDRLVPPMKVCPACDGDREVVRDAVTDDVVDCAACDGTGEVAA